VARDRGEGAPPGGGTFDEASDATRRTYLATERTYLAWWRTGITALAASLAVGRIVPELSKTRHWPFALLGAGYAVLGIALIAYGALRRREVEAAVRQGGYVAPHDAALRAMTAIAILIGVFTLVLVLVSP
jgi:uncharacterized membrane protein YidH (DUF202 family)